MSKKVVIGVRELRRKIEAIRKEIPGIFSRDRLGNFLVKRMKRRFRKEVNPDGVPWKKLSPNTKKGEQILMQTRHLFEAIDVMDADRGGFASSTGFGFRIGIKHSRYTETSAFGISRTVDTAVYGRVHQLGDSHVPQRRFIGLGEDDVVSVRTMIQRDIRKAIKASRGA